MNIKELADKIINDGYRITREDDLSVFLDCELDELCREADRIREKMCGDKVELCTIVNGRSGKCGEDCKFCAQSVHHNTGCAQYEFLDEDEILKLAKINEGEIVDRYSIVTSGKSLTGDNFDKVLKAFERLRRECRMDLCASLGFLTDEQFEELVKAGVTNYHANIETSRGYFPQICTTHTFEDKIDNIRRARKAGLHVCSGGIIGMGETPEDRLDMAMSLAELEIESIPINALMPIEGTPLENMPQITEEEILRTVAFFRFINPSAKIKLAAGRAIMTNNGEAAFAGGASATITGNMLTTSSSTIRADKKLLEGMGRKVIRSYDEK